MSQATAPAGGDDAAEVKEEHAVVIKEDHTSMVKHAARVLQPGGMSIDSIQGLPQLSSSDEGPPEDGARAQATQVQQPSPGTEHEAAERQQTSSSSAPAAAASGGKTAWQPSLASLVAACSVPSSVVAPGAPAAETQQGPPPEAQPAAVSMPSPVKRAAVQAAGASPRTRKRPRPSALLFPQGPGVLPAGKKSREYSLSGRGGPPPLVTDTRPVYDRVPPAAGPAAQMAGHPGAAAGGHHVAVHQQPAAPGGLLAARQQEARAAMLQAQQAEQHARAQQHAHAQAQAQAQRAEAHAQRAQAQAQAQRAQAQAQAQAQARRQVGGPGTSRLRQAPAASPADILRAAASAGMPAARRYASGQPAAPRPEPPVRWPIVVPESYTCYTPSADWTPEKQRAWWDDHWKSQQKQTEDQPADSQPVNGESEAAADTAGGDDGDEEGGGEGGGEGGVGAAGAETEASLPPTKRGEAKLV